MTKNNNSNFSNNQQANKPNQTPPPKIIKNDGDKPPYRPNIGGETTKGISSKK